MYMRCIQIKQWNVKLQPRNHFSLSFVCFFNLTVASDPIIKRIRLSSYMIYLYKFHSIKAKETQDANLKPFYEICFSFMYVAFTLTFDMLTHKSMSVHFFRDCPFSIVRGVRYFCFFYFFISFIQIKIENTEVINREPFLWHCEGIMDGQSY